MRDVPRPGPGFRHLQAVSDLDRVIRGTGHGLADRLAPLLPGTAGVRDGLTAIAAGKPPDAELMAVAGDHIALAAARPQQDFRAFLWSGAVLLRAALSGAVDPGAASDYWQSFAPEYRLAGASDRAAIANAVAHLARAGAVADALPARADRSTRRARDLHDRLARATPPATAALLAAAVAGGDADAAAARYWRIHARALATGPAAPRELAYAVFRHLYETRADWPPDRAADTAPAHPLPVARLPRLHLP